MAGCTCGGECSCLLVAGDGISIAGSGTPTNPWLISALLPNFAQLFTVTDSDTVDLSLFGSGTVVDPLNLRAAVSVKLSTLSDINDPSGGPANGESPVYVGTYPSGHWEFSTLPPSPAGSVNVSTGLSGVGSVGDPIKVTVAAVWGTGELAGLGADTTIGLPVYVDVAGKLRAKPVSTTVDWSNVTSKPATFPPSAHTHVASDITDPLNLNVGKIRSKSLHTSATSSTPPTPAEVTPLGLWFFPKGS